MRWLSIAFLFLLGGCAGPQALVCHGAQDGAAVAELFFGRNIDGRLGVSDAAWRQFLAAEVTPRFPDGLTVIDAAGQWRDRVRRTVVREPSKVVIIVMSDRARDEARIAAVIDAYKRQFHQQSVGLVVQPACVTF